MYKPLIFFFKKKKIGFQGSANTIGRRFPLLSIFHVLLILPESTYGCRYIIILLLILLLLLPFVPRYRFLHHYYYYYYYYPYHYY